LSATHDPRPDRDRTVTMQSQLQALATQLQPGGGRIANLRRLSGGASQDTWAFDLVGDDGRVTALVLRRAPPGAALRSGTNAGLAAEAALIALAADHGVPVPPLVLGLRDEHGLGEGFVMTLLAGETLGRRIVHDARFTDARRGLARRCGQVLARIHALPRERLPALREASAAAELAHCRDWHRSHGTARPVFELALQWLAARTPADALPPTLVHGDFRNGNLIVGEDGLRAVLDWELAHLGDPMQDLGWLCVNSWRFGRAELPVGGFGTLAELFDGYADAGGRVDPNRVHWWQVLGTLQWGVICEGFGHAWMTGAEPELEKAAIGRRASETEIDLLQLLAPRTPS
jgi:aminoglycoside phosphotransferase (APT) family kinase protein